MALVDDEGERVCVDRWEARLETVDADGSVKPWSPYEIPDSETFRAVSEEGAVPQGYISGEIAGAACEAAGKRLCTVSEWRRACRGPEDFVYPYGNDYVDGACNEGRQPHPLVEFYGTSANWIFSGTAMNDPGINQQADSLAPAGSFSDCVSAYGVFDMHGNLHEWVADESGTFLGGFYVDASLNGAGCGYTTKAHDFSYHDYSTGFRCCRDAPPG